MPVAFIQKNFKNAKGLLSIYRRYGTRNPSKGKAKKSQCRLKNQSKMLLSCMGLEPKKSMSHMVNYYTETTLTICIMQVGVWELL